ncbi:MAG TPA: hypothetical protein VNT55_09135 [Baekduia sp.]|nr:hypothetical protein [Baekduia sp.]
MRRAAALALLALTAPASFARADDIDPVRLTVTAPPAARVGAPISVGVTVAADAGALDLRAGTLRVGVRLAPICGGSFATTADTATAIDAPLSPQPTTGAAFSATIRGSTTVAKTGDVSVCTYLLDDDGRQWATDTDSLVEVNTTGTPTGGNTAGSGSETGGSGSGPTGCTPTLSPASSRAHRGGSPLLHYRACTKGRYRFVLLHGKHVVRSKTIKITKTGRRTTRLPLGRRLAAGAYKLVLVPPSGQHVRATRTLRVVR